MFTQSGINTGSNQGGSITVGLINIKRAYPDDKHMKDRKEAKDLFPLNLQSRLGLE